MGQRAGSRRRIVAVGALVVITACGFLAVTAGGAQARSEAAQPHKVETSPACGDVSGPFARCSAVRVLNPDAVVVGHSSRNGNGNRRPNTTTTTKATTTTTKATTTTTTQPSSTTTTTIPTDGVCTTVHSGYTPCDLQDAYALPSDSAGSGKTVAIVDAFDNPNAEADLGVYRAEYGLAPCTTANGCFRKVNQNGGATPPSADPGWGEEIALDLDMVSAVCPNCNILLVEANSNGLGDLLTAENRAASMGASVISNSWGAGEFRFETSYDSYFDHGIPITASTGDNGYGVSWPASSPTVTAVGGTSLTTAGNARGWSETAWDGAGSGCSSRESKPTFQHDTGCSRRAVGDVSAIADPQTGVAVYDTYGTGGDWLVFGGTSVAAPIIASVYALAGNGASISSPSYAYSHSSSLFDVTSGSNGSCGGGYLCTAGPGYDGPTGLGTPNGVGAF
ncbi:MAG TPA: S53 family peptidase [Acidimicrobiia bacterium]|jgi:subtilase family serine protease|nr:S53 family peptidase [Acidimicrobiia bacterium]